MDEKVRKAGTRQHASKFGAAFIAMLLVWNAEAAKADPLVDGLRSLQCVDSVVVHRFGEKPTRRIIHVLDWHFVPREDFDADVRDQSPNISPEELAEAYSEHLTEVATVQAELMAIVRHVSKSTGVKAVHVEGLTTKNRPAHLKFIKTLASFETSKPDGDSPIEQFLLQEFETDCLSLGAAGRLAMTGRFTVLPVENHEAYLAANPVQADGRIVFDPGAMERREDAIVGNLLTSSQSPAVAILGNGHDLADSLKRIAKESVELITILPKSVAKLRDD